MKGGHLQLKQGKTLLWELFRSGVRSRWLAGLLQARLLPPGADYGQISEETWQYLLGIYGGGPEIAVRQTVTPADPDGLHGERKIEAETRAL